MGFLNNTSQTIDAILTKRGRERLAQTGQLNITKFALADDEVDYALWDPSHPNGTNSYGTVIENMPVLEPVQDQSLSLRYKLVTRADEPEKLAFIDSSGLESQTISYFPNNSGQKFTEAQLTIGNTQNSPVDSESYTVTVQNSIVCVIPQQAGVTGDFNQYAVGGALANVQTAQTVKIAAGTTSFSVRSKPILIGDTDVTGNNGGSGSRSTNIIIQGDLSGAVFVTSVAVHAKEGSTAS